MKGIKRLLELCRQKWPSPRVGQEHNVTLRDGVVVLTLMMGDVYQGFNLDDTDLDRDPESLIRDIARLMKKVPAEDPTVA